MAETQSVVDIAGEWFLGAVKAHTVQIGAGGILRVDNTTPTATVTVNGTPVQQDYVFATRTLGSAVVVNNNAAIAFSSTVVSAGTSIEQTGPTEFTLNAEGMYELAWQMPISDAQGQVGVFLVSGAIDGGPAPGNIVPRTVVGQAQGLIQLSSRNLLNVTSAPFVFELWNVTGAAITLTANAGGPNAGGATISIIRTG